MQRNREKKKENCDKNWKGREREIKKRTVKKMKKREGKRDTNLKQGRINVQIFFFIFS